MLTRINQFEIELTLTSIYLAVPYVGEVFISTDGCIAANRWRRIGDEGFVYYWK